MPDEHRVTLILAEQSDSFLLHALEVDLRTGTLEWDRISGEVAAIEAVEDFRRRGVGTALWLQAVALHAEDEQSFPAPMHSIERSADGDAWARSVGGHLPSLASAEDFGLDAATLEQLRS